MNMSYIEVRGKVSKKYKILAEETAEKVIEAMNYPKGLEVAIDFVSEKEIKRLNNEFREIDRVTDVLSFPSFQLSVGEILDTDDEMVLMFKQDNGFIHFGDMALCLKQTKRQAKEFGVSVESEIKKLVIHSMLHLMGYDHIEDSDYEIMKKEEERLDKIV
jgi:probable rRNA maturation factor